LNIEVKGDTINGALTFRIFGPMLSVPVDLFMSRFKTLTSIFNRIIDCGIYPNILKNAKVSPIFKSGGNVSLQITDLYPYYLLYPS
jgi:hypothetical protein